MSNDVLDAALDYHRRGFSVFPLPYGRKKYPENRGMRWKHLQEQAASESQVRRWFSSEKNVAIVCGTVSNLVVRDFDDSRKYQQWKANHRDLATRAPTVATGSGFHVYCTMDPIPRLKVSGVDSGELRGTGAYVVAPPSIHPSGVQYSWTIPLSIGVPLVTFSDLDLDHLDPDLQKRTEEGQKRDRRVLKSTEAIWEVLGGYSTTSKGVAISETLQRVIQLSLPSEVGQRERRLFDLARRLKSFEIPLDEQIVIFDRWFERARSVIGTKSYEVSMNTFLRCVENAQTPLDDVIGTCLDRAKSAPKPDWSTRFNEDCQLLAGLCRELQRHNEAQGNDHFYLSCRSAGDSLGISHNTANIYLALFQRLRKLAIVEHGTTHKATRWKYVG